MGYPRRKKNHTGDTLKMVNFRCASCEHRFEAEPGRIEEAPERAWHPYLYYAACPECGEEAEQAPWEKGLMAAHGRQTGPRTPEGKARVSENLAGHPTPEEALRTRFNAMKHGLFSRVARYFPAKPGKYPHCNTCEYLDNGCEEQVACLRRTELFLRYDVAFETGDPSLLMGLQAETQAMVQAIINDILLAIVSTGVELKQPEWYFDPKSGDFHLVSYEKDGRHEYVYKVTAHPLLKTLSDFLAKNNMSLADLNMTPKGQEDQDLLRGYLDNQAHRESLAEHQRQQQAQLASLAEKFERSRERLQRDPVLIEYDEADSG